MNETGSDSEKLKRRERELSILNKIARELSSSINLEHALDTALTQVAALLDLNTGWIFLRDEKTNETHLAASLNLPPALKQNHHLMEGTCYCLELYQMGNLKAASNVNVITCSRLYSLVDGTGGLRFHASIPINVHDKRLGVMNVASTNWKELSAEDLKILYTIGDFLGVAIERASFFEKSMALGAIEERYRLARELHDTLGQGLAAIILRLETADALLEAGSETEKVRKTISYTLDLARTNLEEARRSVLGLRATSLDNRTLDEAIDLLVQDLKLKENLQVIFENNVPSRKFPVLIESGVLRITQEILTNIVRHARAVTVKIRLEVIKDKLRLIIADDGTGFKTGQIAKDRYGLIGLNERTKLLKGKLKMESTIGQGTRFECTIPLENKNARLS
jgi:two-component system NarL family sensor kinase